VRAAGGVARPVSVHGVRDVLEARMKTEQRLGMSQKQQTAGAQEAHQPFEHPVLGRLVEVNRDVAAEDRVELGPDRRALGVTVELCPDLHPRGESCDRFDAQSGGEADDPDPVRRDLLPQRHDLLRQAGPALDARTAGALPEPRRSAVSGTFRVAARSSCGPRARRELRVPKPGAPPPPAARTMTSRPNVAIHIGQIHVAKSRP